MPEEQFPVEGFKETMAEAQQGLDHLLNTPPFKPILDRVLVRRIEAPATADGFGVPEKYRQHSNLGIVIALGDGVVLGTEWVPLTRFLSVGQKVLYGEYTAERWDKDDNTHWVVRIQEIRGIALDKPMAAPLRIAGSDVPLCTETPHLYEKVTTAGGHRLEECSICHYRRIAE